MHITNAKLHPAWKTGIRISLRGTASSADYIYNFRVTENGPGPGEVHGKRRIIGPAPPGHRTWRKACINISKHIEVLKLGIIKSANK